MDIIESAEEGTASPQRAEIKKVIAQYHKSRGQATSPRDENFSEIPSEYSAVLTYGLARSQTVQQSTIDPNNNTRSQAASNANADAERCRDAYAPVYASGSRSRFAEIKHTLK